MREIYEARKQEGATLLAVVGDFNDIPGSAPLAPCSSRARTCAT